MVRRIAATALSALTGIGGHFLNGRADRAQLFLALFFLWPVALVVALAVSREGERIGVGGWAVGLMVLGFVATWLASLAISFRDAGAAAPPRPPTGIAARFSALVLSLVVLGLLYYVAAMAVSFAPVATGLWWRGEPGVGDRAAEARHSWSRENFWQYLHFGGMSGDDGELPAPPPGDGYLVGRIAFDGQPAAGVSLDLTLNGKFRTPALTTDDDGRFALRLPPGDWFINRLRTTGWTGRPPEGEFVLSSERDAPLPDFGGYHRRGVAGDPQGWPVTVTARPVTNPLQFTIRQEVVLEWPRGERPRVSLADATVKWRPYPEAAAYAVSIYEVERHAGGWTSREIAARQVRDATQLPLGSFKSTSGAEDREYAVHIAAFAADGRFLSETQRDAHFVLADGVRIVGEDIAAQRLRAVEREFAARGASPARRLEHRKRLAAVEVLIDDDLLVEAERLLAKVDRAAEPGTKEAMLGYLRARQGRCTEAKGLFERAESAGGKACVADRWRAACTGPG